MREELIAETQAVLRGYADPQNYKDGVCLLGPAPAQQITQKWDVYIQRIIETIERLHERIHLRRSEEVRELPLPPREEARKEPVLQDPLRDGGPQDRVRGV